MLEIHVFTCAAANYIPKVRMLFESLRQFHPEWRLHLALADDLTEDLDLTQQPFDEICTVSELGIPDWRGWAFCHDIVELSTAIKPFMLARLLRLPGCKKVVYLDPDTVAFSRLDDILEALDESNIVLTPHQTRPEETLAAVIDNEICSLKHGIYNLGFIAVAATEVGHDFADWWSRRLYHFCRADIPNGLFTDQRWIDLVPALFSGIAIMRSSRHNLATWNVTTRELRLSESGQYLVDGEPLGFYHFTGFDSGTHRVMAIKNGGDNPALYQLVNWYGDAVASIAQDPLAKKPWAFGVFSNGISITKSQRLVYRERTDLQRRFPDPFDASTYLAWWETRGRAELPDFFQDETRDQAIGKLSSVVTPGFRGGAEGLNWTKLGGIVWQSISRPKNGLAIGKRGWEVLRNSGLNGIARRFEK